MCFCVRMSVKHIPCKRILFDTSRYNINDVGIINGIIIYYNVSDCVLRVIEVCFA
jgi:hypothetical protein